MFALHFYTLIPALATDLDIGVHLQWNRPHTYRCNFLWCSYMLRCHDTRGYLPHTHPHLCRLSTKKNHAESFSFRQDHLRLFYSSSVVIVERTNNVPAPSLVSNSSKADSRNGWLLIEMGVFARKYSRSTINHFVSLLWKSWKRGREPVYCLYTQQLQDILQPSVGPKKIHFLSLVVAFWKLLEI